MAKRYHPGYIGSRRQHPGMIGARRRKGHCGCPSGAKTVSTRGRGLGVACMAPTNRAPRFVKKGTPGARLVRTKRGNRYMKHVPGWRFVAPLCT